MTSTPLPTLHQKTEMTFLVLQMLFKQLQYLYLPYVTDMLQDISSVKRKTDEINKVKQGERGKKRFFIRGK
jgi:hypothetical protein